MNKTSVPSVLKKIGKGIAWTLGGLLLLLALLVAALQLPAVQTYLTSRAAGFLEKKIKTRVTVGGVNVAFPKKIVLEDVYIEDQRRDTLLHSHRLAVDVDMWGLTKQRVAVQGVELETFTAHVRRTLPDSVFNYQYIVNAFSDSVAVSTTDTTSKPWAISLEKVGLENIYVTFRDELGGQDLQLKLGEAEVAFDGFDPIKSTYHVDQARIAHSFLTYRQSASLRPAAAQVSGPPDTTTAPLSLALGRLNLLDLHVRYADEAAGRRLHADIGESELTTDTLDLAGQHLALDGFLLRNSLVRYQQEARPKPAKAQTAAAPADSAARPWRVRLDKLKLAGNQLAYDDFNSPAQAAGLDFAHLYVRDLAAEVADIRYAGSEMQADVNAFSLREKSGFEVREFRTAFRLTDRLVQADDLRLRTAHSTLTGHVRATFRSLAALAREYPAAGLDIRLADTRLALRDALYFQPGLRRTLPVRLPADMVLALDAAVRGRVDNLAIDRLDAGTLGNTRLRVRGHVRHLPDIHRTRLNLSVLPFETSALDLRTVLPPAMLPASIRLPAHMQLTATFSGAVHDLDLKSRLATSLGGLTANARVKTNRAFSNGSYRADVRADRLALGRLLKQEKDLGTLTATARVEGSGFAVKDMRTQVVARVQSVDYKKYTYRNVAIDALAWPSQLAANVSLADSNLNITLIGSADFRKKVPNYVAVVDLKDADWRKLHLTDRDLRTRARITADLNFETVEDINGYVDIRKVAVASKGKVFAIDSMLYASIQEKGRTDISLESDVFSGFFRGNIHWKSLYGALENHLARYYELPNRPAYQDAEPQNFEFGITLKNTSLLTSLLVPGLDTLRPGRITGRFDSRRADLDIRAEIFEMAYNGLRVDTAVLDINSTPRRMQALFTVERVRQADVQVNHVALNALAYEKDNDITTKLTIRDSVYRLKYLMAGYFHRLENEPRSFSFRFFPDSVRLNYRPWQVAPRNAIDIVPGGVRLTDLVFSEREQRFSLGNVGGQLSSLRAGFENFRLETLGAMVRPDTALVGGLMNGYLNVFRNRTDSVFTADLKIDSLKYTGKPVGDIALAARQRAGGRYDADLRLTGNGNQVALAGYYQSAEGANTLHFDGDLAQVNLASFAPFAAAQVRRLTGNATGKLTIRGSTADPDIDGQLTFRDAVLNLKLLNSPFRLNDQTLRFDKAGIRFREFTLLDSAGRALTVNGLVGTADYSYYTLDLRVLTDRFQVLNTTADDNPLYYGNLLMTSTVLIRGDSYKPVVTANLKVAGGSNVTYAVPQSDEAAAGREGIVRFVDIGTEQDIFIRRLRAETAGDTVQGVLKGYEFSANIEIDSLSTFNVVIDPVSGDRLAIKGETTLSLSLDAAGNIDLTGRYQVLYGTYNLSFFNLVQRQFALEKNSSITWKGNPLDADLNLRAVYRVEAPPAELIKNRYQEQNLPPQAKQRLPFLVVLNLKGQLLKPEISFALDMPRDKQNALNGDVYSTIREVNTRESELNKQVFSLFLLQRFMAENPLESTGGGGLQTSVRSSVSKILSDQFNRLADKVKGVELNLDVNSYEDYASGNARNRTDLELGLSKNLLNDRIVVKVSGNVNVEGSPTTSQQNLSNFLGDLQLEYKITEDGRLRLLGFRQRDFDIVSGELIRTGAGVIFVRDYNALRELFIKALEE